MTKDRETIKTLFENGHFYSPVVDPADIRARMPEVLHPQDRCLGIDFNDPSHEHILRALFPKYLPGYAYPDMDDAGSGPPVFFEANDQFSHLDSRSLFVLLQSLKPRKVVEVGSGFSTLLMADVNRRFLSDATAIQCIEPYPRPFLLDRRLGINLTQVRVELVSPDLFESLASGDLLFIDSSHVSKTGSDVNYLFFEVMPRLSKGVYVHLHDIFLPQEYPTRWVVDENRSWNEQYLLRAFLMYNQRFKVVFGSAYAALNFPTLLRQALGIDRTMAGGSLYLEVQ